MKLSWATTSGIWKSCRNLKTRKKSSYLGSHGLTFTSSLFLIFNWGNSFVTRADVGGVEESWGDFLSDALEIFMRLFSEGVEVLRDTMRSSWTSLESKAPWSSHDLLSSKQLERASVEQNLTSEKFIKERSLYISKTDTSLKRTPLSEKISNHNANQNQICNHLFWLVHRQQK